MSDRGTAAAARPRRRRRVARDGRITVSDEISVATYRALPSVLITRIRQDGRRGTSGRVVRAGRCGVGEAVALVRAERSGTVTDGCTTSHSPDSTPGPAARRNVRARSRRAGRHDDRRSSLFASALATAPASSRRAWPGSPRAARRLVLAAHARLRRARGSLASPGMSSDFRKVALIAASLGLLVSLFFALRPDDDEETAARRRQRRPPTDRRDHDRADDHDRGDDHRRRRPSPAGRSGRDHRRRATSSRRKRFSVKARRAVVLVVEPALTDHVHLHGYDLMADVAPGSQPRFASRLTAPGRFEIELEDRGHQIGELEVHSLTLLAHGIAGVRDLPIPFWLFFVGRAVVLSSRSSRSARCGAPPARASRRRHGRCPRGSSGCCAPRSFASVLGCVLRRSARRRLLCRADRGAVLGGEPGADLRLHRLLARRRAAAGAVRQRLVGAQPVARGRQRGRVGLAQARGRCGGAARVPAAARRLARRRSPSSLRSARARLRRACEPARARARHRALQLRDVVRDGRVRPPDVDERGNGFTVYFGLLARIAPFGEHDGGSSSERPSRGSPAPSGRRECSRSSPSCSARSDSTGSPAAPFWQNLLADVEEPYIVDAPRTAELLATALSLVGLVAVHPRGRARLPRRNADRRAHDPVRAAAGSRVRAEPRADRARLRRRALLHGVRDQGQYIFSLASDPLRVRLGSLRHGDLLAEHRPVPAERVWYVQVGSLVAGHVAGLAVAHDRAVTILPARDALRSQYAMLGPDGALHGRWAMAAVAGLALVAHGGVGGAIVEALLALVDRGRLPRRLLAGAARQPLPR